MPPSTSGDIGASSQQHAPDDKGQQLIPDTDTFYATAYEDEPRSAFAFDTACAATGLFKTYPEVPGTLTQPRPGQVDKSVRIDRILIPNQQLLGLGWRNGIVGIEIKDGNHKPNHAIAQAMDYARCIFTLPEGFMIAVSWVFIWPLTTTGGVVGSICSQHRVGAAFSSNWVTLQLKMSSTNLLRVGTDGTVQIGNFTSGGKVGSR